MATAEISLQTTMGAGAPVYAMAEQSQTMVTTTSSAVSTVVPNKDGLFARIVANGGALYVAISKTSDTAPRFYIPSGGVIDIGPLKTGDTINARDA